MHELLLVPRPFIPSVLRLAHSHQLGAHLGVEKTLERIKARFYWPGIKKAVEDFCRSCPECQQVALSPESLNSFAHNHSAFQQDRDGSGWAPS